MTDPTGQSYVAHITAHDIRSLSYRNITCLTQSMRDRLGALHVDVTIDPASRFSPAEQVSVAIGAVVAPLLPGKAVSASVEVDMGLGDVSLLMRGGWQPIATVELAPVQTSVRAA